MGRIFLRSSVTIADVAARAGCSKSTVARVLNDRPDVNPETRARILEIIEELAFVPDERARALASGRSATIGLMVANLTSPYMQEIIRAIEGEARRAGYAVLLIDTSYDPDEESKAVELLWRKRVEGVAVVPVGESSEPLRRLVRLGLPTVLLARYFPNLAVDVVRHDNHQSAYLATRHLLDLGHRRIVYLSRDAAISTVADRLAGIQAALVEHGLAKDTVTVRTTETVAEGGYQAIRAIGEESPGTFPYTAVLAYNDYTALGVQRALLEAGYQVPCDVSLVACSDSGICDYLSVRLTAVRENWRAMGRAAFQILRGRLQGDVSPPRAIVLPTELIVRESTTRQESPP